MNQRPYVGQRVRLNDSGYERLHLHSKEAFEQSTDMKITLVENVGYEHSPVWAIDVDQPLINQFLLDATMVEPK